MHHHKSPHRMAALCAALAMTLLVAGAQLALALHYNAAAEAPVAARPASGPVAQAAKAASRRPHQPG